MNEAEVSKSAGVFEGIVAILFGVSAVFWPGTTIVTLLYLFAAFVLAGGLINLMVGIFSLKDSVTRGLIKVLIGGLQIGVGTYLFRHPHVTFHTLVLVIGLTMIFRGVFEIVLAFATPTSATIKTFVGLSGALSVIVGIIVLNQPASSGVAFIWILGLYALIAGPLMIAAAVDGGQPARKRA